MKGYKLQTPKNDHQLANHKSKSKRPQKISKKCLDSAFSSVSEDVSLESPKDTIDSSISEIPDDHRLVESTESFIASLNLVISPSSETFASSNLTPLSSIITSDNDETGNVSASHCRFFKSENSNDIIAVEAEMVVNHLKQVINSTKTDLRSKKLLDALIEIVIEEFNDLPKEEDRFSEILSMKTRVVLLSFFLWILAVTVMFFFRSGVQSSFTEPPPT